MDPRAKLLLSPCSQELLQDETRQKLSLGSRMRTLEEEKSGLVERVEEEQERSKELTRQIQATMQQVCVCVCMCVWVCQGSKHT